MLNKNYQYITVKVLIKYHTKNIVKNITSNKNLSLKYPLKISFKSFNI